MVAALEDVGGKSAHNQQGGDLVTDQTDPQTPAQMPKKPWYKRPRGILLIVFGVLAMFAALNDDPSEPEPEPEAVAAADPCPVDGDRRTVTADCVDPWPLTVDTAEVWCEADAAYDLPYVDADGTTWALTGAGYTLGEGRELDDSIWADNPDIEGAKVAITALTDAAEEMC